MRNPIKYKIEDGEITIYTQRAFAVIGWIMFGFVLGTVILIVLLKISLGDKPEPPSPGDLVLFAFIMGFCGLFFILASKKIIVSKRDETIYSQYFFSRRSLARFSEVDRTRFVDGSSFAYRIFLKTDVYGKGIALTAPLSSPKYFKAFEEELLPLIRDMIFNGRGEGEASKADAVIENYQYYNRTGNVFIVKRKGELIWSICLICIALSLFCFFYKHTDAARFMAVPMFFVGAGFLMRRRVLDTDSKTFIHSFWIFYRKVYKFDQFYNFNIVRISSYGAYDGTEVRIVFLIGDKKTQEVALRKFRQTQKIELFLNETRSILGLVG